MSTGNLERRLQAIEERLKVRCDVCGGAPYNIVQLNDAGDVVQETLPGNACPACLARVRAVAHVTNVDVSRL